jgi:hypothetical protein
VDDALTQPNGEPAALRPNRTRAVLGAVVVVLVVLAAAFAIYQRRHAFADAFDRVGVAVLLGSFVLGVVAVALTCLSWRSVVGGLGVHTELGPAARVFFTSQLGKYLPGSVWPVLIQMEAGRRWGAARRTMLAANLISIVLGCGVGLLLASALLPFSDTGALSHYWWLLLALPALLALVHPRAIPALLDRLFALARREPMHERLDLGHSLRAAAWSALSFVMLGLHVAVLVLAIGGGGIGTVLLCVGGMALAVSGGILFIPAPAGAGIRDVILALVLQTRLSPGEALAVVVASRALLVAVDLSLAGVAAVFRARAGQPAQARNP